MAKGTSGEAPPRAASRAPSGGSEPSIPASVGAVDRKRVVIENVTPCVEGGRFPAKRCAGDSVQVEADIFADGHDVLRARLLHRRQGEDAWTEVEMAALPNDHWAGSFDVPEVGVYEFNVMAWTDEFATWRHELPRWTEAADIETALLVGAGIVADMARRARGADARGLGEWQARLEAPGDPIARRIGALDDDLTALAMRHADRRFATIAKPALTVAVEPRLAGFSAWYEMFPRS
ncbi:MAG TPA: maltotransferase domain-containing protein, partial [Casimicrobiaceae bacterium]